MDEIWIEIKDFPYYQISNLGRVRSIARVIYDYRGFAQNRPEKILTPTFRNGYRQVHLCRGSGEGTKIFKVARLVAYHFLSNPDNLNIVNHKNGIKADNRFNNLEWCDTQHNIRHAFATKLNRNVGASVHTSKLSEDEAKKIFRSKLPTKELSDLYCVAPSTIRRIRAKRSWKSIN